MSTHATLIIQLTDGTYTSQYVHFDGYLSGVGATLNEYYHDQTKVEALSALGSISVLDAEIDKPEGHTFAHQISGYTVAYGRDRGETDVGPIKGSTLQELLDKGIEEYAYVWKDGAWFSVDNRGDLINLGEALQADASR